MEKQEYVEPEVDLVALEGDLVATVSGTSGTDSSGGSVDVPGVDPDGGDGEDIG